MCSSLASPPAVGIFLNGRSPGWWRRIFRNFLPTLGKGVTTVDSLQRLVIEHACARLMNQFAVLNDSGRFGELAELFVEDAKYARPIAPDAWIEGRAAIQASFEARPKERVGRHLISNIVVDVLSPERATGVCYALLYSGSVDKPAEKFGLQAVPPQLVGEYYDEFVLTPDGWKFAVRKGRIIFSS